MMGVKQLILRVWFLILVCFPYKVFSSELEVAGTLYQDIDAFLQTIVGLLATVLFYPVPLPGVDGGFPFLVLWLVLGGVFFSFRLGFVNIRLFFHAFAIIRGKYTSKDEPGEITHAQAFFAAVSATVGLGNIAGVAVAVTAGGPGAVFWMIVAGFLGMSTKFAEVTLGQKYRKFDKHGRVSGGAFHYLRDGLAELNMPQLGKVLAVLFSVFCLFGALGGGNMFQSNQMVAQMTHGNFLSDYKWVPALVMAIIVGLVLIGGIKRIATVAQAVVPLMSFIYIIASLVVIITHVDQVANAFAIIVTDAFTGEAIGGGIMGALIAGFKRSAFSNEAGLGSSPIAHSAAKTNDPIKEGCVALLEPFMDTIVICTLTGLVITITGVYNTENDSVGGILLTSQAFGSVISWFPNILTIAVTLFAFSTMLSWSYYGERAWTYLFGHRSVSVFYFIFCLATFVGGVTNLGTVIDLSDLLLLSMSLPNLVGLYLLSPMISRDLSAYVQKLRNKELPVYSSQEQNQASLQKS